MLTAGLGPVLAGTPDPQDPTNNPTTLERPLHNSSAVWNGDSDVAYIFGGTWSDGASDRVYEFDPAGPGVNFHSTLPDALPTTLTDNGRTETGAVWQSSNNTAYIFGGRTRLDTQVGDPTHIDDIALWKPDETNKTLNPSLPSPRSGTSAVWNPGSGDQVAYIFGGRNATGHLRQILEFDPAAGTVQEVAKLPNPTAKTSAVWDEDAGAAYIFGGTLADGSRQNTVIRFQPPDTVETLGETLGSPRSDTSAVWNGTAAFVFGGNEGSSSIADTDRVVPDAGTTSWHPFGSVRSGTSAVFDGDGSAYVFGGRSGSSILDEVVEYSPAPVEHNPDLTHAEPTPWDSTALTGNRLSIQADFDVENLHPACGSNETGCALPTGAQVGVYVRELRDKEGMPRDLADLTVPELKENITGDWPAETTTLADAVEGGETQTISVPGVSLKGNHSFGAGDIATVIGVIDWCKEHYVDETSDHCAVEEEDGQETILYDQWILRPSLDITTDVVVPRDQEDQIATSAPEEGEFVNHTEVLVNVTNLGPKSLDFNPDAPPEIVDDLVLNYTVDGKCPDGANEPGEDPCETIIHGPDPGETTQERIRWRSDVAGERDLSLTIRYPHLPDVKDGTEPDNHPTFNSASDSFYYKGVDWAAGQTLGTTGALPGDGHIEVQSTVANVGDLAGDRSVGGDSLVLAWDRCNRLTRPADGYRCPAGSEEWQPLNRTESLSQHAFDDLGQFPPGGTVDESITWEADNQTTGVWSVRSFADSPNTWKGGLEHSEDNNVDRNTVRLSDVAWTDAPRPFEQEFVDTSDGAPLDFELSLSNEASNTRSFEVFRAITDCKPSPCNDVSNWKFHLLDGDDAQLNGGQGWHPGGSGPVTVEDVPAGDSVDLTFQVVPQNTVQPDHFVNATLVVCEADPGFEPDDSCLANGDLIRTRAFFDPPWDPLIKMQSASEVSVDQGDTASFFFKVENGAEELSDAFQLTATIDPASAASEPQWKRLDPISDCPNDDHTVDQPQDQASPEDCSDVDAIAMDPGEQNRFRMRTTVGEAVPDDTVINVTLEAISERSQNDAGPVIKKTKLLRIGVGTDIAPPQIEATPASGAVLKPGTPIAFNVTDDSGVASVERQIDDGRFQAFEGDDYVVDTAGRPDGDLRIRVRARDEAAREQTKTFRYVVDGTRPAFQAVQVDPSVAFVGGTIDLAVGLSEDNPSSVVAETAGATHDLTFRSATGLWEADDIPVSDQTGVYSVSVTATDHAGNKRTSNASYEVVRPDVSIVSEDVTTDPRSPTAGETLTVTARLSNPTGADITDYPVVLRVGNETVATTNATLVANAKTAVTLEWVSEPGGHDLSVCADPEDTIPDPDRGNQCGQVSIRVRDQSLIPGPEIVIIAAALVLGALGRRRWDARDAYERYPRD